jgi:very-short-patch-repair endonuclease
VLWHALRDRLAAYKFRRQHPIGQRVADFACPAYKLVVELDGADHARETNTDAERSAELATHGYRVLRFWNNDVLQNLDGVLATIGREVGAAPPHPTSPPQWGREESAAR